METTRPKLFRLARAAAFTIPLILSGPRAWSMDFSALPMPDGQTPVLLLEGEIVPGDAVRFRDFLASRGLTDSSARLILNSPGGNVSEADDIALSIRRKGLSVSVLDGQMCASACFLLFAASLERSAAPGAMIGVHSVSLFGEENLATVGITTMFAREASGFGVPPDVIGKMVTTQPSDMAWLTDAELREMKVHGLGATPPPERTPDKSQDHVEIGTSNRLPEPGTIADGSVETGPTTALVYRPAEQEAGSAYLERPSSFRPRPAKVVDDVPAGQGRVADYVAVGRSAAASPSYVPGG